MSFLLSLLRGPTGSAPITAFTEAESVLPPFSTKDWAVPLSFGLIPVARALAAASLRSVSAGPSENLRLTVKCRRRRARLGPQTDLSLSQFRLVLR